MIIRKKFKVEVAHRVLYSYTKRCQGVHGHSYIIELKLKGNTQNKAEMLVDFKEVKDLVNPFIDSFDHSLLVWDKDYELCKVKDILNIRNILLPYSPTAEQMSRHIYYQCVHLLKKLEDIEVSSVIVHETDTGYAEYKGEDNIKINLEEVVYSEELQNK